MSRGIPTTRPTHAPTTARAGCRARRATPSTSACACGTPPRSFASAPSATCRRDRTAPPTAAGPGPEAQPIRASAPTRSRQSGRPEAMSDIAERLEELERLGLSRRMRMINGPQGPTVLLDGSPALLLCSNNYLGLADHPRVREAAAEAAMRYGAGSGASRLVSGNMTIHRRLERRLAEFKHAGS